MQYLGGKTRIAKPLAAYLESRREGRIYLEPFMGAGSVLFEMSGNRLASDAHPDLILMWKAVQSGWMPPESVSEAEYAALKVAEPSALRGYVGFQGSFGGKWFGGYARDPKNPQRNYIKNGFRWLGYGESKLNGVHLYQRNYREWTGLTGFLIYCDPPYEDTTAYSISFSHDDFWQWVREMSKANTVLVSSYKAPDDFTKVWTVETRTNLEVKGSGKSPRTENLYEYKS